MKSRVKVLRNRLMGIFFLAVLSAISGCDTKKIEPLSDTGSGSIVGVNYTGHGIQWFTINGVSGSSLGRYSGGGGHLCCAIYPKIWTPKYTVTVKWERSDGRDSSGTRWKIKPFEKVISVDEYIVEGNVYVLFLPDDKVKIFISVVGIGNPDFPTHPGFPEDAEGNG